MIKLFLVAVVFILMVIEMVLTEIVITFITMPSRYCIADKTFSYRCVVVIIFTWFSRFYRFKFLVIRILHYYINYHYLWNINLGYIIAFFINLCFQKKSKFQIMLLRIAYLLVRTYKERKNTLSLSVTKLSRLSMQNDYLNIFACRISFPIKIKIMYRKKFHIKQIKNANKGEK